MADIPDIPLAALVCHHLFYPRVQWASENLQCVIEPYCFLASTLVPLLGSGEPAAPALLCPILQATLGKDWKGIFPTKGLFS